MLNIAPFKDIVPFEMATRVGGDSAWRPWLAERFLLLVALYFVAQALFRLLLSPGIELDEAEQLVFGQTWAWGYGSQPPLYVWLFKLVQEAVPDPILALTLLKNGLLFLLYLFFWLSARELGLNRLSSSLATLSLILIPQVAWESQRDLTNSVLATTAAAASLYLALVALRRGSLFHYLLVALAIAAGCLAKYNFAIFVLGMLIAFLAVADYRRQIDWFKAMVATLLILVLLIPHLSWVLDQLDLVTGRTFDKLGVEQGSAWWDGILSLLLAVLSIMGLFAVTTFACFWRRRNRAPFAPPASRALLDVYFIALLALFGLLILFGATNFKERWLQPLLFVVPIRVFVQIQQRQCMNWLRIKIFTSIGLLAALLIFVGLYINVQQSALLGKTNRLNEPFPALSEALRRRLPGRPLDIFVHGTHLAGGIKLGIPQARVYCAGHDINLPGSVGDRSVLALWQEQPDPPPRFRDYLRERLGDTALVGLTVGPVQSVSAPFFAYPEGRRTIYFARLDDQ